MSPITCLTPLLTPRRARRQGPRPARLMAQQPQTPRPVQQQNPQPAPLGPGETNPRRALLTIIVTVVVVVAIVLGLGFFVNWGLAALSVIIMIPGAISLAVLAKHPESTGGRSMFGISDPNTLLDPIRRPSERRGE